jgi:hypothetical protein
MVADGCCPAACNANNDADCRPRCGNGVVESGETCDPPSSCPSAQSCNDGDACTTDSLTGSAQTCTAQCAHVAVTRCSFTSDGCCPQGCTANNDADCVAACGNGVVETGERCDIAIPAGQPGACPQSCPTTCQNSTECPSGDFCSGGRCTPQSPSDGNLTCHIEHIAGTACNAHCVVDPSPTTCGSADACCPFGCTSASDNDCQASWTPSTLRSNISFTTSCFNIGVTLQAGHSYVVTTCVASGTALASNGDTILEVRDPTGNLVAQDDDCIDTPNLISLAGWSCQNGFGDDYASCAGETPGGFLAPVSGNYTVCLRAYSSSSTGTATVTLWSN